MTQPLTDTSTVGAIPVPVSPPSVTRSGSLTRLLGSLDEAASIRNENRLQDRLIEARLGVASALFTALRAKHSPSAQHCLRVALRCSSLGRLHGLNDKELDHLEVASLLHDVGKIGVPDQILTKPAALTEDELIVMNRQRAYGLEILAACTGEPEVLDIVRYAAVRYDGQDQAEPKRLGEDLPLGARILAIADAFDAMTTDHVYRKALPRERALAELFRNAGTQFDPSLVRDFAKLSSEMEAEISESVTKRWTRQLCPASANALWQLNQPLFSGVTGPTPESLFQQRLLDAMHDGVIFIDSRRRIVLWNRGAERLSGISRDSVYEKTWSCQILDLRDTEGNSLRDRHCPVEQVIRASTQSFRRLTITRGLRERVFVDMHVIPVIDQDNRCYGATLLLHDVSSETSLEERVQNLHEKATTDPLTGAANRAEFDRVLSHLVESSLKNGTTFSIMITDIDRFKQVNDVHGHQAGDAALVSFASLLQENARQEDLVARYGGEEFVMLCPDCDNATAARRAEEIRQELSLISQPMLNHKCITASFGVTELQMGDTPESILRRADRALYQAKDSGRNRVVQLGAGLMPDQESNKGSWLSWLRAKPLDCLLERQLMAQVPINLLVEKIKGFISDNEAEIVNIEDDYLVLALRADSMLQRRQSDRPVDLVVEMKLREVSRQTAGKTAAAHTIINVVIRPRRGRDRRRQGAEQATRILSSLRSYLIAQDWVS